MAKKKRNVLKETIERMDKEGVHLASLVFYDYSKVTKHNPTPRKIVMIEDEGGEKFGH